MVYELYITSNKYMRRFEGNYNEKLLSAIIAEAVALSDKYENNNHIWQALTNMGVKDQSERTQIFKKVIGEVNKKIEENKSKSDISDEERKEYEQIKDDMMMEDAAEHERRLMSDKGYDAPLDDDE